MIMDLKTAYQGAKIIETVENYSIADETHSVVERPELTGDHRNVNSFNTIFSDEEFWQTMIKQPNEILGQAIKLYHFVVSDWVARIPGLYWTDGAKILRKHTESDIAFQSPHWIKFHPPGKSKKVLGGVGTILLPPTDDGKVLISLSSSCNASTGIPALVYPEVLEAVKLKQGDCVDIENVKWVPMSVQWLQQFPFSKEVPRGYLVIDDVKKIHVRQRDFPVIYHPFSIMEYESSDTLLYDFVFVSADSKVKNVDFEVENFFLHYGKEEGRHGKYLLNPNMVKPIFESRYSSPSDLRQPSEKAKLDMLYQRVRNVFFNNVSINLLVNELPKHYQTSVSIRNLAERIGVKPALLSEDSAASMSSQLISLCIERDQTEVLIDRMVFEYPNIFK